MCVRERTSRQSLAHFLIEWSNYRVQAVIIFRERELEMPPSSHPSKSLTTSEMLRDIEDSSCVCVQLCSMLIIVIIFFFSRLFFFGQRGNLAAHLHCETTQLTRSFSPHSTECV
jgi:hypothetical protein